MTTRGEMAAAVERFDSACSGFRGIGLDDFAAQTQVPKIMALSMLGAHDRAAECAEATQRELVALGNLAAASRVSQNLGGLLLRRDRYVESVRHYREAAVMFARVGDAERSVLADIGLGNALAALGDFDEAMRIYARARMRATARGLAVPLALIDESAAFVDLARGRYREALQALESARRAYEALALPQHLAIAEKQLAQVYLELRLLPEALALFVAAIAKFRALDLPDEQAWAWVQRGRTEVFLGRVDADGSLAAAAELFELQANDVGLATVALARAELALARDDGEAALRRSAQALAGFIASAQPDGRSRAEVVQARALLLVGRAAEAGAAFDATLTRALALGQLAVQVRCLTGQGLVALAAGDPALAGARFDAAITLFEFQRRALPDDGIRSAFLAEHLRPYEELLRMALAGGSGAEVLGQLERVRARALGERLVDDAPTDDSAEVLALRDRLHWLYRRAQQIREGGDASEAVGAELLRTEDELLERARRERIAGPLRAVPATTAFSVDELMSDLAPGDALVEYGVLDDELFACVVTRSSVALLRRLAAWASVREALEALRFQMDALRHGAVAVQRHLPVLEARAAARLAAVAGLVWASVEPAVRGCRRLLIVPQGPLAALPFAALLDDGVPLGLRFELALAPSARLGGRGLRRPSLPATRVIALGESSRLVHAADEAEFVAGRYAHGIALTGDRATAAALRAGAPDADVVHLACHAEFRSDNPRFSALHLRDGRFSAEQAEALRLKPCTVVLSACETGVSEAGSGDEMIGLVRAFLVAGAARVLGSLWPVDDAVTRAFMGHFHDALVGGRAPALALQRAQSAVRHQHPHPHFWAAFTLYGAW